MVYKRDKFINGGGTNSLEKKYHFEKLTLKDDVNISVYEEALDYVFESDDIRNVAISGAYGAGKSSVLASYKKKHTDKNFLHISLAHFDEGKKEVEGDDKQEHTVSESVLEGKIINQLIHQISSESIPKTNFKVKQNTKKCEFFAGALWCFAFLLCVVFICFFDEWRSFARLFADDCLWPVLSFTLKKEVRLIVGVVLSGIVIKFLRDIIKLQKNKNIFRRFNVQGNEIEIFENQDDSFFDKYLNEVLYLFENSDANVIVFEDMDRFEMNRIFERLREVNTLVNIQLSKKEEKKILRFFYLLRDDMFVSKDRTKFFDYIVPIVPVVDGTNSFDQFIEHLDKNNLTSEFEKSFLQGVSLYIDDMRLLKNVCNEFLIYYRRLNTTDLNLNKMFAMITYKNLFPRDFSDLQNGQGYVKSLFDHKEKFIVSEREKILDIIEAKKEEINTCRSEQLVDVSELDIIKGSKHTAINTYPYSYKQKDYDDWVNNVYPMRKNAIENKFNGRLVLLNEELNSLELQLAKLESRQLKDIINRDNTKTIFHTPAVNEIGNRNEFVEIRGSEYFALLKYLIGEGYIDETYADYMTYFYPNSLSVVDKKFLRSIRDKQAKEYTYSLKNPPLALTYLNVNDFEEPETLNFDLFDTILTSNEEYLECFVLQLKARRSFEFLSQYFVTRGVKGSICKIIKYWPEYFFDITTDICMTYVQIREVSLCILLYCDCEAIEAANINGCLTEFVAKISDYLNVTDIDKERLIKSFELINVKFQKIDYDISEKELFKLVYDKSMYCITFENIRNILEHIYSITDDETLLHKNWSTILSLSGTPIYDYIKANTEDYFEIVFDNCDGEIRDDEEAIINMLNDESISDDIKIRYISLISTKISDISKIKNHNLWNNLLEAKKLIFSENNLYFCFTENKSISKLLVDYINNADKNIDLSLITVEQDEKFIENIFEATITCFDLTDEKYGQILSTTNLEYQNGFNEENIPISKMNVLIDNGIIKMSSKCLASIRDKYEIVLYRFIKHNIGEYVGVMTSDIFVLSELVEILNWDIEDGLKLSLLEFTNEKISVINKSYSDRIVFHILKNNFLAEDMPYLLQNYNSFNEEIKSITFDLSIDHFTHVIGCSAKISTALLEKYLSTDKLGDDKKGELFAALIQSISIDQAKMYAMIMKREDLALALVPNKRPRIKCNTHNKNILDGYKKRGWIYDFLPNESNAYYSIRRSSPTVNRSVEDILL